jgi:hypothetical protein
MLYQPISPEISSLSKDKELIENAQHNHAQFQKLYTKYWEKIFKYFFYRLSRNEELAEEMTQETFLKAFKSLDTFIADFAYGVGAYGIKAGGLGQRERLEKYERLLEIERETETV